MKPDKEMRTQQSVLNLSTQRLIVLVFSMLYLRHILTLLYIAYDPNVYINYVWLFGFAPLADTANQASWGLALKTFFIWDLVPFLLFAVILSKYTRLKFPNFPYYKIISLFVFSVGFFAVGNMIVNGFFASINFSGYEARYVNLMVYGLISIYLSHLFCSESVWKMLLIVVLGVMVVAELWELPLNLVTYNKPLYVFVIRYLQRYIPLFLWFYMFRDVYRRFLVERWYRVLPLLFAISILTVLTIAHYPLPIHNLFKGFFLRLSYALLLIFLPFHHSTQKR